MLLAHLLSQRSLLFVPLEVQLVKQDVILIEVTIVAPLGPPSCVDDIPLQLVEGALDFKVLLEICLAFEDGDLTLLYLIDFDPEALEDDLSLLFGADSLAEAAAELFLLCFLGCCFRVGSWHW